MPMPPAFVGVQMLEAKPNRMFTEEQRQSVLFLRYSKAIPCAESGNRRRVHWTLLWPFRAKSLKPGLFVPFDSGKVHLPLTPVCASHLLALADQDKPVESA